MWDRQFFVRYRLGPPGAAKGKDKERAPLADEEDEVPTVTGQVMVKVCTFFGF
jgi:hypothetical protein